MERDDMVDPTEIPENYPSNQEDPVEGALRAFSLAGFKDGEPIPRKWFYDALGIAEPTTPGLSFEDAQKLQLKFLGLFERFKSELLENDCLALKSVQGFGYAIVPVADQTHWAQKTLERDLTSSFRSATARLTFMRVDQLTPAQKNEAVSALANVASMRAHMNAARAAAKRRKFTTI
jgi:hypothetical protein